MSDQTPKPATSRGLVENFIGTAWLILLTQPGNPTDCVVGGVAFEPGCLNNWHSHPAGQGYYQEQGQPAFCAPAMP